jgi:hypothetical protein
MDGKDWTEIDRKMNNGDLKKDRYETSFAVAKWAERRFIQLTQAGKNHSGNDHLVVQTLECFRILRE